MRKISKLLMLAAASSALFTGAAMAGGAPATLGGSASFTGGFFIPSPAPTDISPTSLQGLLSGGSVGILTSVQVVETFGPLPTSQSQVQPYVNGLISTAGGKAIVLRFLDSYRE